MTVITNKLLRALAQVWASVFCLLIISFIAIPDERALINALWGAQMAVIGLWAVLYCIRGVMFVGEGVAERKKTAYPKTSRD